jgi:hypothetical protein
MSSIALQQYIAWEPNAETKAEAQALLDSGDSAGIDKACGGRIAFGTAGLRGPMAAGYKNMNDLVILQTVQGLCMYLKSQNVTSNKVVIGYDHRRKGRCSPPVHCSLQCLHRCCSHCLLPCNFRGHRHIVCHYNPIVPSLIRRH